MKSSYDAIIIGGGHNGLVTAAYLARAGKSVLVLERRHIVGGACVTEEVFPGFKVSTAAYVNSLFRKEIIRDLHLHEYGFALLERNPSSFTPFPDGRHLFLSGDGERNRREIAKFSTRDAENYPKYEAMLERIADVLEPTLTQRPPNLLRPGIFDLWRMYKLARGFRKLGTGMSEAIEMLTGPALNILDRWFESDELKATLATDAIIGAMASPSMPGTAYVLFHHVMGETNGKRGVWAYVRGGMGSLTQALARAATAYGADIRTEADVARILVKSGAVAGVALRNGGEYSARVVASNADANVTFNHLLDNRLLPPSFAEAVNRIRYDSASLKINAALSELPALRAPGPGSHAPLGRRSDRRPAGQAPDVDVHPVCSLQTPRRRLGFAQGKVRRSLLRFARGVRPEHQEGSDQPAGAVAAGPGADLRPDGRQHLPGGDDAQSALRLPAGGRLCRLPDTDPRPVPVWGSGAPWRRRHRSSRLERGADHPGQVVRPV
jgi:phytoene dehydrogenase-like protein